MERLTDKIRNFDGTASAKQSLINNGLPSDYCSKILTKLAEYEDVEEQSLLLQLPCKVGDTIYCFGCRGEIIEGVCKAIQIDERDKMVFIEGKDFCFWKMFEKFGKTVFLTKEEAEQALKQIGE